MVAKSKLDRVKLTKKQQDVLVKYESGLNIYEIAAELNITRQAVQKHLKAAEKKGWLQMVAKKGVAYAPATYSKWRIHGLHFVLRPYYCTDRYHRNLDKMGGYNIRFKNWRIIMHKDIIELRQIKNHEYIGKTTDDALDKMQRALDIDIQRMQQIYGFRVQKDRRQAIKLCRIHLVRGNSVIAKNTKEYQVFYNKLGERFLLVDRSKGGFDHEAVHTKTHKLDMENIEQMLQDYSDESSPRPEIVWQVVASVVKAQRESAELHKEAAAGLLSIVSMMKPQEPKEQTNGDARYIG